MVDEVVRVDAGGWGLAWAVDGGGVLRQVACGPGAQDAEVGVDPVWYPHAHPVWGGGDMLRRPALRVTHADGTLTTRLVVEGVERTEEPDGIHVVVRQRDADDALWVEHHLRTHPGSGVLEQWVEIDHAEDGPVTLFDHDSLAPLLLVGDVARVVQFGGSGWADEWRWSDHPIPVGTTSLASLGGVQPHLQRSPCALVCPGGQVDATSGEVLALSVAWGGNVRVELDRRPAPDPAGPSELRVRAGANPFGAEYVLDPGTRFVTPVVAWTWTDGGLDEVTRRFHDWTRARVLRDPDRLRPLVVNNWEATFFDIDAPRVTDLVDRAADLGADVFLLDDGWFGTEHPRRDDTKGLGDWDPDPERFPEGLGPLARHAAERGIRFGIWVEPEMVNPTSALHRTHPDWVLRDRREPREHRSQLVLDTLVPAVREFAADVVDRTLAEDPAITYLKWDANRPISDPGSTTLPSDRTANVWVDHVHATWQLMGEVARRHPGVEMMLCASGGGRTDHGSLRWFHEFWTSDNTDPVARVHMQWACSLFFPGAAMAAHVTRWGGRPLGFACAVALSGRFGVDLDLAALDDGEAEVLRRAVELARRTQPLVQHGRLERLVAPTDGGGRAAWAYRDHDGSRAVVLAYQLDDGPTDDAPLPLAWHDPGEPLQVTEVDLTPGAEDRVATVRGAELADGALRWWGGGACTARIVLVEPGEER